jgi:hypothetical protein
VEGKEMKLDELLNSKVPYDVVKEGAGLFKTQAKIGERFITFSASLAEDEENAWDVAFYESKDFWTPYTAARTGSGDELKVFSMVIASFKEFLDRYHPEVISFTADKEGDSDVRAKLYSRMAAKYLNGWIGREVKHGNTTHFTYVKDQE